MSLIFGTREIYATKGKEDPQPKYHQKYPTGKRYAYIECPSSTLFAPCILTHKMYSYTIWFVSLKVLQVWNIILQKKL